MQSLPLDRNNNFDLVRLGAALQVALLHSTGILGADFPLAGFLAHFPGVPIFFYISGMMVTASACRRSLGDYAEARFRRIYPALALAFAMMLAILIAFGQIGAREVQDPVFWGWAAGQLTLGQVFNPEMFRDFGIGRVNPSLWTIPVEVGFYMILPVLLFLARGSRKAATALFAVGALVSFPIGYAVAGQDNTLMKVIGVTPLAHFWLFALGGMTYLHWDRIKPVVERVHWLAPLAAFIAYVYLLRPPGIAGEAIEAVLLCAAALWLGMGAPVVVGVLRGYDISYGLYLYHMLAVNSLLVLGMTGWSGVTIALSLAVIVAALSWRYLESIVLRRAKPRPVTAVV